MLNPIWSTEIHGTVEYCRDDIMITAPKFGDGNWRGGWWARYRCSDGTRLWKMHHRRGASFFDLVDDVLIATTHKWSGIYAFSLQTGKKLWSRLGDRWNLLLKLCDWLPCDNEGTAPERIWKNAVLDRWGRLIDLHSGRILQRYPLDDQSTVDYNEGSFGPKFLSIDGEAFGEYRSPRERHCLIYRAWLLQSDSKTESIDQSVLDQVLASESLEVANQDWLSVHTRGNTIYVLACEPPVACRSKKHSRLYLPAQPVDCPHWLLEIDSETMQIRRRLELGGYYQAEFAWADATRLAVVLQTHKQWNWSYRRDLTMYEFVTRSVTET